MERYDENVVEYATGSKTATFTFSQKKWINKMTKYSESHPDEVDIVINPDGSAFGHVPVDWIKISPKRTRTMTEEEKAVARERLQKARQKSEEEI